MVRLALKLETLIENDLAFKCQVFCRFYRFLNLKLKRKGRENEKMTVLVKNRPSKICGKNKNKSLWRLKFISGKHTKTTFKTSAKIFCDVK